MITRVLGLFAAAAVAVAGMSGAPTHAASHANAGMQMMHVMLMPQAFSGVTGTATLSYNPLTGMTSVKVSVKHLEPGSVHPEHIHAGKCTSNGPVLVALFPLTANSKGSATATTTFKGSMMHKAAYINVHLGPGLSLTEYTVLACGELGMSM